MTAAAAVEPTELEELMKAQAEAAHEREVGDATRPTAEDLAASPTRIDVEGLDLFYGRPPCAQGREYQDPRQADYLVHRAFGLRKVHVAALL